MFREPLAPRSHWRLDPSWTFLNHGSYGATPRIVLDRQQALCHLMEEQPVAFMARHLEPLLDRSRNALAALIGAAPADLALVANATTAVATVAASLRLQAGDELLTTSHVYNACRNILQQTADRAGARLVIAEVPFPIADVAQVETALLAAVTNRTRFVLLDHITSATGLRFPVESLTAQLESRGIRVMIDGAHAPLSTPLTVPALGASYYTGNCHKWLCAPKGAAFLWVAPALQDGLRPLVVSHGTNSPRTDRSRFHLEFDWTGTSDATAQLCLPEAIDFMASLHPNGIAGLMAHNRSLLLAGRDHLCARLGVAPAAPDSMLTSMATFVVPEPLTRRFTAASLYDELTLRHRIELPIMSLGEGRPMLFRISAQAYNCMDDYERLADCLTALIAD
jgi:isopenicillin-N epimerase